MNAPDRIPLPPAGELPRRRLKLWELDHRFHCLVIGTCLSLDELRRLARKADINVGAAMSGYELHHKFVQVAGNAVFAARATHKWLDRKFAAAIQRSSACRDAGALGSLWDEATAQGEVAGAFWALITHPFSDAALQQRVYGEVHMLSHLAGHSNHAAQHALAALKRRVAELEEAQVRTADAARARVQALERAAAALAARANCVEAREQELAAARARLATLESGEAMMRLRAEKRMLAAELGRTLARAENAEREAREWMGLAFAAGREPAAPPGEAAATAAQQERGAPPCDAAAAGGCLGPGLCGRRVLYVGGRNRQVAHFRALVARHNGELLHHDGGLSESTARLAALVQRVDAVLCPTDCVSHDACLQVKHLCKRAAKRFVPLRSASLACFVAALREVAV